MFTVSTIAHSIPGTCRSCVWHWNVFSRFSQFDQRAGTSLESSSRKSFLFLNGGSFAKLAVFRGILNRRHLNEFSCIFFPHVPFSIVKHDELFSACNLPCLRRGSIITLIRHESPFSSLYIWVMILMRGGSCGVAYVILMCESEA